MTPFLLHSSLLISIILRVLARLYVVSSHCKLLLHAVVQLILSLKKGYLILVCVNSRHAISDEVHSSMF